MAGKDALAGTDQLKAMKEEANAELGKLDSVATLRQLASQSQAQAAIQKDTVLELKQLPPQLQAQAALQMDIAAELQRMHASMLLTHAENQKQNRCLRLQAAMTNADAGAFKFETQGGQDTTSTDLVRRVLMSFMRGDSHCIEDEYLVLDTTPGYNALPNEQTNKGREAFRTSLAIQIHGLTGIKPRLEEQDIGGVKRWAIYCGD
eukprot:360737-Chlamydomonas_euryale.AAC.4